MGKTKNNLHKKRKSISAPLELDLQEEYGFRSLPIRVGDKVRVIAGDFIGMEGEVTEVDTKKKRIMVDGVETAKADESEVSTPIHHSNVEITDIEKDRMRDKIIERRSEVGEERQEEALEETERSESAESTPEGE